MTVRRNMAIVNKASKNKDFDWMIQPPETEKQQIKIRGSQVYSYFTHVK